MSTISTTKTVFSSIYEFQNHFKENDELIVPPNQSLIIENADLLYPLEREEVIPIEPLKLITYLFCKIVAPLGKVIALILNKGSVNYQIRKNISLTFSNGFSFKTERGILYVKLTSLMNLMVRSHINTLTLAPAQELTALGIKLDESMKQKDIDSIISELFPKHVPFGMRMTILPCSNSNNKAHLTHGVVNYISHQDFVSLAFAGGFTLTLDDTYQYPSGNAFRKRLELGEINVPKNQVLTIVDERIPYFCAQYEEFFKGWEYISLASFIMSQMMLPLGLSVGFKGKCETDLTIHGNELKFFGSEDFQIVTHKNFLFTNLKDLGEMLLEDDQTLLKLEPNQELYIYGFHNSEIENWFASEDKKKVLEGLGELLMKRNPVGYSWACDFHYPLSYFRATTPEGRKFLKLVSPHETTLRLSYANVKTLVLNILLNSNKALLSGLEEADPASFIFILFNVLFHYCCEKNFISGNILPQCFKESTNRAVADLLQEKTFKESLQTIVLNKDFNLTVLNIIKGTPEEFDNLEVEQLDKSIIYVINKLRNLANLEQQGSPFLIETLNQVKNILSENPQLTTNKNDSDKKNEEKKIN